MVLRQLSRDYERRRQKLTLFIRKDLPKAKESVLKDQMKEIEGIIERLRSAESLKDVYDHYRKRVSTLVKERKRKHIVLELRNLLQAIVYAEEHKNKMKVDLKTPDRAMPRDMKKDYKEKVKPLIDDFLEEDY